jgi:UDP-N-acetyl-D-glucosamine dehydrogenase
VNELCHKSIKNARVLIIGLAYKKDVDDMRESPSLKLIDLLIRRGACVDYHDPYIPLMPRTRRHDFSMQSIPLTPKNLASYDLVIVATDHSCLDYEDIITHSQLVLDTRNVIVHGNENHKLIKA